MAKSVDVDSVDVIDSVGEELKREREREALLERKLKLRRLRERNDRLEAQLAEEPIPYDPAAHQAYY